MRIALIAALSLISTPLAAQKVEVADGDWSDIPMLQTKGPQRLYESQMARIEALVEDGKCPAIGRKGRVNMTVPFLVKLRPGQAAEHLIVRRIGCPEVEQVVAGAALTMVRDGIVKPTGENQRHWYRGEVSYFVN